MGAPCRQAGPRWIFGGLGGPWVRGVLGAKRWEREIPRCLPWTFLLGMTILRVLDGAHVALTSPELGCSSLPAPSCCLNPRSVPCLLRAQEGGSLVLLVPGGLMWPSAPLRRHLVGEPSAPPRGAFLAPSAELSPPRPQEKGSTPPGWSRGRVFTSLRSGGSAAQRPVPAAEVPSVPGDSRSSPELLAVVFCQLCASSSPPKPALHVYVRHNPSKARPAAALVLL